LYTAQYPNSPDISGQLWIILFHILHEEELHLPPAANVRFLDSETNESLTTAPPDIREDYERRLGRHLDELRAGCAARRIEQSTDSTWQPERAAASRWPAAFRTYRMRGPSSPPGC
jgi:hypothetical protein